MIKAEHMPDEAVMPIAWAIYEATTGLKPGDELYEDDGYAYHWEEATNTLVAALNAWPQARGLPKLVNDKLQWGNNTHIMLPLKSKE